jgi:hypothetical protein
MFSLRFSLKIAETAWGDQWKKPDCRIIPKGHAKLQEIAKPGKNKIVMGKTWHNTVNYKLILLTYRLYMRMVDLGE